MPLSLLFLQLFTHGLIRVAMLPFGIRQCFSVTYCTVSTTRTMRKCQLFLGKPQLGGRKYIAANRKLYPAFPTGNDVGSCARAQHSVSTLVPKPGLAHFVSRLLVQCCIMTQQEQVAWLMSIVWSMGWDIFSPLYLQFELKLVLFLQPTVAT